MNRILRQAALRRTGQLGLLAFICVLIWPAAGRAEVSRVEIAARRDYWHATQGAHHGLP